MIDWRIGHSPVLSVEFRGAPSVYTFYLISLVIKNRPTLKRENALPFRPTKTYQLFAFAVEKAATSRCQSLDLFPPRQPSLGWTDTEVHCTRPIARVPVETAPGTIIAGTSNPA
jgi:hypothetical protein